jgi:hypothetical protein
MRNRTCLCGSAHFVQIAQDRVRCLKSAISDGTA